MVCSTRNGTLEHTRTTENNAQVDTLECNHRAPVFPWHLEQYFNTTNVRVPPLSASRGRSNATSPRLIQRHPSYVVFQEEDMSALWRTLQERGFCCSSPSSPFTRGEHFEAADGGTEPALPEARGLGKGGVEAAAGRTGTAERGPGGSVSSTNGSRGPDGEGQGGGLRLQREGSPVVGGGGDAAPRKMVDIVLHSVAHAPTDAMRQGFLAVRTAFCR